MVFLWSLVIAITVAFVSTEAEEPSDVVVLTKDTFDDFLQQHELSMVEFYAPWCGHCQSLAPEYKIAASQLKDLNIPLGSVECTTEIELCSTQEVQGYPTLKVFRGKEATLYRDARKAQAIVSYMKKQQLPPVTSLSQDSHDEFTTSDNVVVVCYLDTADSADAKTFETVAKSLRDEFMFGIVTDASVAPLEKRPSVVIYKTFDEKKDVYDGEIGVEQLQKYIRAASIPLIGEIGPETYAGYMAAQVPLAYIFAEKVDKERLVEELKPLAKRFKSHFNLATIDATAFGAHAGNLNLGTKWPAIAIHDIVKNHKFPLDQSQDLSFTLVEKFFEDFVAGNLLPSIKSEEIPTTSDGPVTIVVGKNYDEVVLDDSKDVLIEFYAPWCGHCKKLAPIYEKLGDLYNGYSDKVVIAKCDATLNDIPDQIQGFPTIKLYPAKNKSSPIEFTGARTVSSLASFIAEHGTYKIDVQDKVKESEKVDADEGTGEAGGDETTHDEL